MLNKTFTTYQRLKTSKCRPLFNQLATASYATEPKYQNARKPVIPWKDSRIIVAGCQGQIGVPLVRALCEELGPDNVIATDLTEQKFDFPCKYEKLDVTDNAKYERLIKENDVNYMVHMAGILSALGERHPDLAIDVNIFGVVNALRLAETHNCRIFIPSSIAVFGGDLFPKRRTPIDVIL